MSWYAFEAMRGEMEQARDTRLDVDPAVDALRQLNDLRDMLDGAGPLEPRNPYRPGDGRYVPRHAAPGRAKRWQR